eukprot:UN26927
MLDRYLINNYKTDLCTSNKYNNCCWIYPFTFFSWFIILQQQC